MIQASELLSTLQQVLPTLRNLPEKGSPEYLQLVSDLQDKQETDLIADLNSYYSIHNSTIPETGKRGSIQEVSTKKLTKRNPISALFGKLFIHPFTGKGGILNKTLIMGGTAVLVGGGFVMYAAGMYNNKPKPKVEAKKQEPEKAPEVLDAPEKASGETTATNTPVVSSTPVVDDPPDASSKGSGEVSTVTLRDPEVHPVDPNDTPEVQAPKVYPAESNLPPVVLGPVNGESNSHLQSPSASSGPFTSGESAPSAAPEVVPPGPIRIYKVDSKSGSVSLQAPGSAASSANLVSPGGESSSAVHGSKIYEKQGGGDVQVVEAKNSSSSGQLYQRQASSNPVRLQSNAASGSASKMLQASAASQKVSVVAGASKNSGTASLNVTPKESTTKTLQKPVASVSNATLSAQQKTSNTTALQKTQAAPASQPLKPQGDQGPTVIFTKGSGGSSTTLTPSKPTTSSTATSSNLKTETSSMKTIYQKGNPTASTVGGVTGPAATTQGPYALGSKIDVQVISAINLLPNSEQPLLMQAQDGSLWFGRAKLGEQKRVMVTLTRLIVGNQAFPVGGLVLSDNGTVGLEPHFQPMEPSLATDLAQSALAGVSNYANQLASQKVQSLGQNGSLTIQNATPSLLWNVAGSIASSFKLPEQQSTLITVAQIPVGTRAIIYFGVNDAP